MHAPLLPAAVARLFAVLAVFGLVGLVLSVAAPPASAEYDKQADFAGPGGGDGEFVRPKKIVVQESTGNLLVVDSGNDRVQVFAPDLDTATYLSQFGVGELDDPDGIAIDQASGAIYVADADQILKYDSSFVLDAAWVAPAGVTGALAIDQASHDLLVADTATDTVKRYDADGSPDASMPSVDGSASPDGAFTGLLDIASAPDGDIVVVDSATGSIADVVAGSSSRVERFHADGSHDQTLGPIPGRAGAVSIGQATGHVFVAGNMDSYNDTEPLRVYVFDAGGSALTDFALQGPSSSLPRSTIWGVISGLAVTSDRLYVATDIDFVDNGIDAADYGAVTVQVHSIAVPAAPIATTGAADRIATTTASLRGTVDANYLSTKYWFEYGTTTNYGNEVPTNKNADAGNGRSSIAVVRALGNLQPATTYHYRIVAKNDRGDATGADQTFTTLPTALPATSSDRRYERVSPADKNNAEVVQLAYNTQSAVGGDRVVFTASDPFADADSSPDELVYMATRGSTGWVTKPITPPWDPDDDRALNPVFGLYSADLSRAALMSGGKGLVSGAESGAANLYVRDNDTLDDPYRLLTTHPLENAVLDDLFNPPFAAASADFRHVLFEYSAPLTPDAPPGTNVYEAVDGDVRLASILPDGQPAQGAYTGGWDVSLNPPGRRGGTFGNNAISADGRRVFFTDLATNQLYVRTDGTTTVRASASQRSVPDPAGPRPAYFQGAAPDGSAVYFKSDEMLTDDATPGGTDLYAFHPATGALDDLSADGPSAPGAVGGFVGASDDGSRVYWAAGTTIFVWAGGQAREVAALDPGDACDWAIGTTTCGAAKSSRVTPDGRYLLLSSIAPLTGEDTDGTQQVYRYDSVSRDMVCVSCGGQPGAAPTASTVNTVGSATGAYTGRYHGSRTAVMSRDGRRLIFETRQALVSEDTNARRDVYLWDDGQLRLISTGKGSVDAFIADMSQDGDDVFFATRQPLVPEDDDTLMDLYDARIGGGFPAPGGSVDACQADACQGPATVPPLPVLAASVTFIGPGDTPPPVPPTSGHAKVTKPKAITGVRGNLKVKVPGRGTMSVSGSGLKTATRTASKSATYTLAVALTRRAQSTLKRKRTLRTTARVVFTPSAGPPTRAVVQLTFRTPISRKGR